MAIFTPLQGTGGISDATINAMLQSGDVNLVKQANDYIAAREQEIKERGADKGILGSIADLFGFSKLAAAEPNMPSSQKFSNQFSVTQPSQFDLKGAQLFDPSNIMRGSVVEDVVDTPTREFGQIRGGPESGAFGVRRVSRVQDLPVDLSELDYRETSAEEDEEAAALLELAQQEERRGALDILRSFGQDVMNRPIISSILSGAGRIIGDPISTITGGITGLINTNPLSQRTFDAMTPGQQAYTSSLYGRQRDGTPGLLEGYNQISAFGKGAIGTLGDRLTAIQTRKAPQTALSLARQQQITDAINKSINIGEREALKDTNRNVGGIRTDIDVADGGAETSGGKIVCTMMNESYGFGSFRNKIWLKHSKNLPKEYEIGYHKIFLPLVKFAKRKGKLNKMVKKTLEHVARHRTLDLKQEMKGKTHILGRVYRKILEPICFIIGKVSNND